MKRNCPEISCKSDQIIKNGHYFRANDSRRIQRFRCASCGRHFSASTGTLEFGQKKRRVNFLLFKLFAAKTSQRRAAKIAGVNKNTVARKFDYWSKRAARENVKFRAKLQNSKVKEVQFDDLISKEKTKLKPLSVVVAVDAQRRFILCAKTAQIASFGLLAKISVKKYVKRKTTHMRALKDTFQELAPIVDHYASIKSDEHQNYLPVVKRYLPRAHYVQFKSEKSCVAGQGELKRKRFDPLFAINHTMAMLRDGISTLVRRTWATTQDPKRLQGHLEIFIYYYNQFYLGGLSPG